MCAFFLSRPLCTVLWLSAGILFATLQARAQATGTLTTVATLASTTGTRPSQALTFGRDGNLYGVSLSDSTNYAGTVYRVTPGGEVTLLHTFNSQTDGKEPNCKLLLASDGNFYGTTRYGGSPGSSNDIDNSSGGGTVFRITPDGVFTVLHAFPDDGSQGKQLNAGLIQGSDGALYSTTQLGGIPTTVGGDGTIFRLALDGTFTLLHSFDYSQTGIGGLNPGSALVQGSDGNFYGVTMLGGDSNDGVVYKMTPDGTVTTLHSFVGTDGSAPSGPLVEGSPGIFYGITILGAANDDGTFFSVTRDGTLTTLHAFTRFAESYLPMSGPILASDGNFYQTSAYGGQPVEVGGGTAGNVLQLTPAGAVTVVYQLPYDGNNREPDAALVQADDGSFYGTARYSRTVFRLVVGPHPPFFNGEGDLANGVKYLAFPADNVFGYYAFLSDPHFIYHFDLGYEYVVNAEDDQSGVYLYDFASGDFFYTSPSYPFPYLYDFALNAVLYYYPDPNDPTRLQHERHALLLQL